MPELSKKILDKIKSEKISPREKWVFLAKNYGVWLLAIFGIVLAGIFVGNFVSDLLLAEWDIFPRFPGGRINFLANAISVFLLAILYEPPWPPLLFLCNRAVPVLQCGLFRFCSVDILRHPS